MTQPPQQPEPYEPLPPSQIPEAQVPEAQFPEAEFPEAPEDGLSAEYRQADELPPAKRRTGLIIGLVVAVVVVIGAGTGAYFLFFRPQQPSADQVASGFAQSYTSLAHSMSSTDLTKVKAYLCTQDQQAVDAIYQHERSSGGTDATFTMTASGAHTNGTVGSFTLTIADKGAPPQSGTGNLVLQQNQWLVCNTLTGG